MRFLFFSLILLTTCTLIAQPKQNSPYSRYGIGDLVPQYFANQAGMAGQTAAFHDPYHLNLVNPASYAFLRTTTLENALYGKSCHYVSSSGSTLDTWSGNLAYLALGFTLKSPINEALDKDKSPWKYGMGFALTPYSLVGYSIATQDSLADVGNVDNTFLGNGGTYRLTWSGAARYKNTAFGLNLGWMFGKAKYETEAFFKDDLYPTFRDNIRQDLAINGFVWSAGMQHDFVLEYAEKEKETPTRVITVGLTGESNHKLRLTTDEIFLRSRGRLSNGLYNSPDTLLFEDDAKKSLTLPATFTLGAQYVSAKWKVGGQIGLDTWSNYVNEARPGRFRNTFSASAGVEHTPDATSYNRYLKRVRYRLGGYFRQDPRSVDNQDLNDLGVTFGFGFPVIMPRQQTSFINSAFEFGKIGADSPISETYVRITLGFTLNDNTWFYKRRFE